MCSCVVLCVCDFVIVYDFVLEVNSCHFRIIVQRINLLMES